MLAHEKIRLLRQGKSWSQEEMAHKLGMSANGYGCIERGETDLKLSRIEQIAALLNVKLSALFENVDYSSEDSVFSPCEICPHTKVNQERLSELFAEIQRIVGGVCTSCRNDSCKSE